MKVKIKGLVFVGFAAAILSANAMAANEAQTVTSKAYTEATYQHKSTAASIGGENGEWTPLVQSVPDQTSDANASTALSTNAVVDALNDLTAGLEVNGNLKAEKYVEIKDITDPEGHVTGHKIVLNDDEITSTGDTLDTASDNLVTENVIAAAVNATNNAKQAKSTADYQLGGSQGSWKTVEAGTYVAAPVEGTDATKAKIDIDKMMIVGSKSAVESGTNQLTTATGVKQYAQKFSETANQVSDGAGGWKSLNSTVTVTNGTATEGSNGATTQAIVDYVQSQTGGAVIPAQDPTKCTATTPCALVNEAGNLNWRTMATATHAGGVCGNASGDCTGSGDTGSGNSGNNNG